jgi:hypothetical protein
MCEKKIATKKLIKINKKNNKKINFKKIADYQS